MLHTILKGMHCARPTKLTKAESIITTIHYDDRQFKKVENPIRIRLLEITGGRSYVNDPVQSLFVRNTHRRK